MPRRLGLRLRVTVFATVTVGLALTIGALVLVGVLRSRLDDAATTAAELRARDVAALAEVESLPRQLALPGEESAFVQVVDDRGVVVAGTDNIEGELAVLTRRPTGNQPLLLTTRVEPLDDGQHMRIAVVNVETSGGRLTVYAGRAFERSPRPPRR